jgi:hypothetical protein
MAKYVASLILTLLTASFSLAAEDKLCGEWVAKEDDVDIRVIFAPDKTVRSVAKDGTMSGTYSVDYSKKPCHLDICWTIDGERLNVQAILEFVSNDEIRIATPGLSDQPRPKDFTGKVGILRRASTKLFPQDASGPRVGEILVVGNEETKTGSVLRYLPLYPGQILPTKEELLKIEIELLMKFHRRFDLDGGERPRIEVQDGTGEFRDVVVTFPEKTRKKR